MTLLHEVIVADVVYLIVLLVLAEELPFFQRWWDAFIADFGY